MPPSDHTSTDATTTGGRYRRAGTIAHATLAHRGWTRAHIQRLLGEPDIDKSEHGPGRYDRAGVEAAEAGDEQLRQRLGQVAARRARKKTEQTARRVRAGDVVWRRHGDRWVVFGQDLVEGQDVTATRRGGREERKRITQILQVTPEGMYADVVASPKKPARRAPKPAPAVRQVLVAGRHSAGTVLEHDGGLIELLLVRHVLIGEGDPERWGSHLTHRVGQVGTRATCRPAPPPH